MTLERLQKMVEEGMSPQTKNFACQAFNLVGAVGDLSSWIAGGIAEGSMEMSVKHPNVLSRSILDEGQMKRQAGDILAALSALISVMGWNLEEIATYVAERKVFEKALDKNV